MILSEKGRLFHSSSVTRRDRARSASKISTCSRGKSHRAAEPGVRCPVQVRGVTLDLLLGREEIERQDRENNRQGDGERDAHTGLAL